MVVVRRAPSIILEAAQPPTVVITRPRLMVHQSTTIRRSGSVILPTPPGSTTLVISRPSRIQKRIVSLRRPQIVIPPTINVPSGPVVISRTRTVRLYSRGISKTRTVVIGTGGGYNPPIVLAGSESPADILAQWLIDLGLGVDPDVTDDDWPVYFGHMPDETGTPDNAIAVYDTGGTDDGRTMVDGARAKHPGFQVRVRGSSYTVGWNKISAIEVTMSAVLRTPVSRGGKTWLLENVSQTGTIISLGVEGDKLRRDHFTLNGLLTLSEV